MATFGWETPDTEVDVTHSSLQSLANNGQMTTSVVVDNAADKDTECSVTLTVQLANAPVANTVFELHFVYSQDGTNYEAEGTGNTFVGAFSLLGVNTSQRYTIKGIRIEPFKFKPYVVNRSGQTTAASGNSLKIRKHRREST
jgi:hypothetical protein